MSSHLPVPDALRPLLAPHERVLWVGRPALIVRQGRSRFEQLSGSLIGIPFLLFFTYSLLQEAWRTPLGAGTVLLGAGAVAVGALTVVVAYGAVEALIPWNYFLRRTTYALTDRRVVRAFDGALLRSRAVPLERLTHWEARDEADGSLTLRLLRRRGLLPDATLMRFGGLVLEPQERLDLEQDLTRRLDLRQADAREEAALAPTDALPPAVSRLLAAGERVCWVGRQAPGKGWVRPSWGQTLASLAMIAFFGGPGAVSAVGVVTAPDGISRLFSFLAAGFFGGIALYLVHHQFGLQRLVEAWRRRLTFVATDRQLVAVFEGPVALVRAVPYRNATHWRLRSNADGTRNLQLVRPGPGPLARLTVPLLTLGRLPLDEADLLSLREVLGGQAGLPELPPGHLLLPEAPGQPPPLMTWNPGEPAPQLAEPPGELAAALRPGERLLWADRPRQLAGLGAVQALQAVGGAALLAWAGPETLLPLPGEPPAALLLLTFLGGCFLLGRSLWFTPLTQRHTIHAVTTERVLTLVTRPLASVRSWPLLTLPPARAVPVSGTLGDVLVWEPPATEAMRPLWARRAPHRLRGVLHPDRVANLVDEAHAAALENLPWLLPPDCRLPARVRWLLKPGEGLIWAAWGHQSAEVRFELAPTGLKLLSLARGRSGREAELAAITTENAVVLLGGCYLFLFPFVWMVLVVLGAGLAIGTGLPLFGPRMVGVCALLALAPVLAVIARDLHAQGRRVLHLLTDQRLITLRPHAWWSSAASLPLAGFEAHRFEAAGADQVDLQLLRRPPDDPFGRWQEVLRLEGVEDPDTLAPLLTAACRLRGLAPEALDPIGRGKQSRR